MTQLRQRVTLHYHLGPLDEADTKAYIEHRLHVAGANGTPIFNPEALHQVYHCSRGVPRLVNGLCDRALLTGYINEAKTVNASVITEVAGELPSLAEEEAV